MSHLEMQEQDEKGESSRGRGGRRESTADRGGSPRKTTTARSLYLRSLSRRACPTQTFLPQTFPRRSIWPQINTSKGDIAYTVLDFGSVEDPAGLQVLCMARVPGFRAETSPAVHASRRAPRHERPRKPAADQLAAN